MCKWRLEKEREYRVDDKGRFPLSKEALLGEEVLLGEE